MSDIRALVGKLPAVDGMALVREALSHLQTCAFIPSDDRINTEHVTAAIELLRAVVRAAPPRHPGECECAPGYCSKALANGIHSGDYCRYEGAPK